MKRWLSAFVLGITWTTAACHAQDNVLTLAAKAEHDYRGMPLTMPLSISSEWTPFDEVRVEIVTAKETLKTVGQFTAPGIATEAIKPTKEGLVRRDLHLVMPALEKVQDFTVKVHFAKTEPRVTRYAWLGGAGENSSTELVLTRSGTFTRVLRYMNRPFDDSSKEARDKTYKVFHHLYDPAGKQFVTNGGFADDKIPDPKKLLYPHHRGIMYGFNKCTYGTGLQSKADTWHCTGDAHVAHEKNLRFENGPVVARQRVLLGWHGEKKARFAEEERELTVFQVPGGTMVEFASRLKTTGGKIHLDGDPQHAGFQFRAHNDVAEKSASQQTYYLHPDGKGEMGKERNWPQDKTMVDLPWYAMSFVLGGQRYSVCYLNHPSNPKETRLSERSYGRFGGYFERDITEENPLVVQYRLFLQAGEITPEFAQSLRIAFVTPPRTEVK